MKNFCACTTEFVKSMNNDHILANEANRKDFQLCCCCCFQELRHKLSIWRTRYLYIFRILVTTHQLQQTPQILKFIVRPNEYLFSFGNILFPPFQFTSSSLKFGYRLTMTANEMSIAMIHCPSRARTMA